MSRIDSIKIKLMHRSKGQIYILPDGCDLHQDEYDPKYVKMLVCHKKRLKQINLQISLYLQHPGNNILHYRFYEINIKFFAAN